MQLTKTDLQIIQAAQQANNPSVFTNYFIKSQSGGQLVYPDSVRHNQYLKHWTSLGKPDKFLAETAEVSFYVYPKMENGILLFFEERGYICLPWHLDFWRKPQKQKTVIGLSGTGKTLGIGMLACYVAATTPFFRFLNVAPNQYQSGLMEREIRQRIDESQFRAKFIKPGKAGIKYRPYIQYTFTNGSTLEFMNVSDNADNIQSWSGDWINLDEAGLLDVIDENGQTQLSKIMIGLASRMRGERPDGRPRMGLLSLISMAYANDTLWQYYDNGQDPDLQKRVWSRKVFHSENPYLTPEYLRMLRQNIPPGLEGMWLRGEPPPRMGKEFADSLLEVAFEKDQVSRARGNDQVLIEETEAGVVTYEEPKRPMGVYAIAGDPGTGEPPSRNAPVIVVMDVTDFPKQPARLAAFWWGYSGGKYGTFIDQFAYLCSKYAIPADYRGYDSTGTQKSLAELAFTQGDIAVHPMDFSGSKKMTYISALKLLMGKGRFKVPSEIFGIRDQLRKYQLPDKKLPQDIVSSLAMVAYIMFPLFIAEYPEGIDDTTANSFGSMAAAFGRYSRPQYARHQGRARGY